MGALRLGMIGCGQISQRFFEQAAKLDALGWDVHFTATCAAHEESARAAAERHGARRWYTDYRRLIDDPDVDGVVITTPHQFHSGMATAALRANKHALIEKPMTTRWEHALELGEAARGSSATCMALPFVNNPTLLTAIQSMRGDVIGRVTGAEAELSFPGPPRSNWYYSAEAEGGAMLDTMVYPLARLAALMGPARRITALVGRLIDRRLTGDGGRVTPGVDDQVSILLEYPTGQHAQVHSIWSRSYMTNGTVIHGRHGAIFVNRYGRPLVVRSELRPPAASDTIDYLGLTHCYAPAIPEAQVTDDILAHFITSIRERRRPWCDITVGMHIAEQQMMAYRSAQTGQTIDLTTTFTMPWEREPSLMSLAGDWF